MEQTPGGGGVPSQVQLGGGYPVRSGRGGDPGRVPPGPGQDGGGEYPVRTPEGVLTTRRAVCLLRSRRRIFLFKVEFCVKDISRRRNWFEVSQIDRLVSIGK